jgi:hypothetical protein
MDYEKKYRFMTEVSFSELQTNVEQMNEEGKASIRRELEGIALRAAMFAAYIDSRQSYGASDSGHKKAVKNCNRAGKLVWTKAFGYNAFLTIHI